MSSRSNRDRLKAPDADESIGLDLNDTKSQENKTQGLHFTVPTEFVDLPSGGRYYQKGHPLHNVTSVEMRHMTAKEEDILVSESLIQKGVVIDRLLQSLLVDDRIDLSNLLSGDKSALTVAARITGYGPDYRTSVDCPSCGAKQEFTFDLNKGVNVGACADADELNEAIEGVEATENGTFLIDLPKSGHTVEIRLLTSKDELELEKFQEKRKKRGLENSSFLTDTLKSMIIAVGDITDRSSIQQFVETMPAIDSRYLREIYRNLVPSVDLTQEFSCSKCDFRQDLEVPVNIEFFWPR
tara:strand:- start:734 stop:1624 length:891 start_codon:yes stop_codon:yes gene_type:complete